MSKKTPNPMEETFPSQIPHISQSIYPIAGIKVIVYGLDELSPDIRDVACLWLLHPRLSKQEWMGPIAALAINEWNTKSTSRARSKSQGLIAVSFDQRNHGTRLIDNLSNEPWRGGNPKHAQDMYSCYHGTFTDMSHLITYLPAYTFPENNHSFSSHMVLGVSLGGHAGWHCILHDPRVTAAIIVIGCADYVRLMQHRAMKSKLDTWKSTNPPGSTFLGSKDFPSALLRAVERYDPAGFLMGEMVPPGGSDYLRDPSPRKKERLRALMRKHVAGKRILLQSGGADKMVPYETSEPFLKWFKKAIAADGWFANQGVHLKDVVYSGVGHEMTPQMLRDSLDFIMETLTEGTRADSKL